MPGIPSLSPYTYIKPPYPHTVLHSILPDPDPATLPPPRSILQALQALPTYTAITVTIPLIPFPPPSPPPNCQYPSCTVFYTQYTTSEHIDQNVLPKIFHLYTVVLTVHGLFIRYILHTTPSALSLLRYACAASHEQHQSIYSYLCCNA